MIPNFVGHSICICEAVTGTTHGRDGVQVDVLVNVRGIRPIST